MASIVSDPCGRFTDGGDHVNGTLAWFYDKR